MLRLIVRRNREARSFFQYERNEPGCKVRVLTTYRKLVRVGATAICESQRPSMKIAKYDIFFGEFGRDAIRLEAVDGLEDAVKRMRLIAAKDPGPYFVFCQTTNRVMFLLDTSIPRI
jgi:hypothetical protein